jgi:hypothetical protein
MILAALRNALKKSGFSDLAGGIHRLIIDRLRRACLQENAAALLAPLRCPADGFRRPSAFRINKSAALVVLRARPSELRG